MKLVIDCHNIGYAAHFTTGQLSYKGMPTGVIYGFFNKIFSLARDLRPDGIIFTWDSKKSFRKKFYPDYKKREKSPEELEDLEKAFIQFHQLKDEIIPELGFNNSFLEVGLEADDLIAWIVNRWPDDYFIISADQDLYQLLMKDHKYETKILSPKTGKVITSDIFYQIYGIRPHQWPMAKAIGGCNSDKVPGIPGISDPAHGPNSRAIQYLRGLLKKESKFYDKIESDEGKEIINRNLNLVTLPFSNDIDIQEQKDHLSFTGFKRVFHRYGFNAFKIHELMGYLPISDE